MNKKKIKEEKQYIRKDLPATDEDLPEEEIKKKDLPDAKKEDIFEYIEKKDDEQE